MILRVFILITGILAAVLFVVSGFAYLQSWGNFRIYAIAFLSLAIIMFILVMIRNIREEWKIGGKSS
ncbi:MAG: hypothetical protein H6540_03710 [Bacteroidales bacterium]|nr:hypothetical protein [Bacteroidales bacterium]